MNPLITCVWFTLVPLAIGENVVIFGDEAHRRLAEKISGQSFKTFKKILVDSFSPYFSSVYGDVGSEVPRQRRSPLYRNVPDSYPLMRPERDAYRDPVDSYRGGSSRLDSGLPSHQGSYRPDEVTYRGGYRPDEVCCADCRRGDIRCLARCIRVGCTSSSTCASAGDGAYAAFCQRRCGAISGMSIEFLPDPACRGLCASEVQRRCRTLSCEDYGCYEPRCEEVAPSGCNF